MAGLSHAAKRDLAAAAILGGGAAVASLYAAPGPQGVFGAALGLLMMAIAVIDARAFRIPDSLSLAAFLLGLAAAAMGFTITPDSPVLAALRGAFLAFAFLSLRVIYFRLRGQQGIGLGDVKLAAAAGAWLDWPLIPAAIELAAVTAIVLYCGRQLISRQPLRAAAKLPFGLFFAPAIWLCWLIGALLIQG